MFATLFQPASPQALAISQMMLIVLALSVLIFLIVSGGVSWACFRFREKNSTPRTRIRSGNLKLEITWTVLPLLTLIVMFFFVVKTMHAVDPPSGERDADIIITGHQWWWEVRYPKAQVLTANEIHLSAGIRYLVRLESADVIHDFWIPALARKIDAVPDHANYLYLEANQVGIYEGVCAEFCGTQHAGMRLRVEVQTPDDFKKWVASQSKAPHSPQSPLALEGEKIFQQKTCLNCHSLNSMGATEAIGPDLTFVATRKTLGSGVLKNSPENLAKWLANPQKFKPGVLMPNFQLSEKEIAALVAYLEALPGGSTP